MFDYNSGTKTFTAASSRIFGYDVENFSILNPETNKIEKFYRSEEVKSADNKTVGWKYEGDSKVYQAEIIKD